MGSRRSMPPVSAASAFSKLGCAPWRARASLWSQKKHQPKRSPLPRWIRRAQLRVTGSAIGDRYGATFSIEEAATARDAVAFGYEIFTTYAEKSGLPAWPVVRAEALTFEQLDRDLETPNFPEVVGVSEIAELIGVTRQRASAIAKRADFPAPVATLSAGPVWTRVSLNRFVEEWPRKEGRPRRSP